MCVCVCVCLTLPYSFIPYSTFLSLLIILNNSGLNSGQACYYSIPSKSMTIEIYEVTILPIVL